MYICLFVRDYLISNTIPACGFQRKLNLLSRGALAPLAGRYCLSCIDQVSLRVYISGHANHSPDRPCLPRWGCGSGDAACGVHGVSLFGCGENRDRRLLREYGDERPSSAHETGAVQGHFARCSPPPSLSFCGRVRPARRHSRRGNYRRLPSRASRRPRAATAAPRDRRRKQTRPSGKTLQRGLRPATFRGRGGREGPASRRKKAVSATSPTVPETGMAIVDQFSPARIRYVLPIVPKEI